MELQDGVKSLAKGVATGKDGVPPEFFQECLEEIQLPLLKTTEEVFRIG